MQRDLKQFLAAELAHLERAWPRNLPQGVIHADLFPDNVFFLGDKFSGLIDFYFACTDALAYDVAICLNAWCFETDHSYNVTKGKSLLQAYAAGAAALRTTERARAAVARPRRCAALSADSAGRLVRRAAGRAGAAEGSARILPQAALPPGGHQRARLRHCRIEQQRALREASRTSSSTPTAPAPAIPGPGGWGAILAFGDHEKELKGGEAHTTNNRMELMAAIAALEALKRPCLVDIHTDSQYLRNGIMSWINNWKRNGWRTADKSPVKNVDLWKRLDAALAQHRVRWHWVRGHAGHALNERADKLAREGIERRRARDRQEPLSGVPGE